MDWEGPRWDGGLVVGGCEVVVVGGGSCGGGSGGRWGLA